MKMIIIVYGNKLKAFEETMSFDQHDRKQYFSKNVFADDICTLSHRL